MNTVFLGVAALVGLMVLIQGFVSTNPATLAVVFRRAGAAALMALAGVMLMTGRVIVAVPIFLFALSLAGPTAGGYARWLKPFLGPFGGLFGAFGAKPTPGRRSTVRSAALEMQLDHDSGTLSGRVLAGRFEGFELARLSVTDLVDLWREVGSDPESRSLLEAYLDRRAPLWRDDAKEGPTARQGSAARPGAMTDEEAHQILGLGPGATEAEVRQAHRRLMKAVHPDMGGSTFLAAKINEAKDRLVGRHGTRSNH
ncbi:molecular chaperone DnaJ [Siculibacillus lacustris]|uniref:Molecular chaperone DnaJ n=1 Tax=Siculibacillus lacustris TaxID=1549641 RepID=A0A4Q9VGA2_9HYPH|nr:molecular chaperone DnaJ [Siculibacillus lacustris]TBW34043.1 molecular chaperone DnaJ [Siculibacillus lacustris]